MKNSNTRALTEGAILAAITALIGIISFYMPLFFFLSIFWAVPIIIIGLRNGLKISIISTVVSSILVSIFTTPAMGLSFILVFGLPGITMGFLLNRGYNTVYAVLISGLVFAICNVAGLMLSFMLTGVNISSGVNAMFKEMQDIYSTQITQVMGMYAKNGMSQEQLEKMFPPVEMMMTQMRMMIPSIFIMAGMVSAFVSFKASRLILNRVGYAIKDIKKFQYWRLPSNFLTGMFIMLLLSYIGVYFKINNADTVLLNIFTIMMAIVLTIGLSIVSYYMIKRNVPKVLRIIILFLGFLNLQYIVAMIGIFDSAFNLRKLNAEGEGDI